MAEDLDDPAQAAVSKGARLAITAASMAAEQIARLRAKAAQELAAAEGDNAERLQSRWDSERDAARAQVSSADQVWLDRASIDEAAAALQTANVWARFDPNGFSADEARIAAAIESRYGVDVREAVASGRSEAGDLRGLADAERARERQAEQAREDEYARERVANIEDELGAGLVLGGVAEDAAADRAAIEQGEVVGHGRRADALDVEAEDAEYDTEARRRALSQRAAAGGADKKTVEGRVQAANANARPGRQATSPYGRKTSLGRPPAAPSKSREIER